MSEQIILAQALYNALGKIVSTKSSSNMRFDDDQELLSLYESSGAKSFDRKINGVKVGTSTIRVAPEKNEYNLCITNQEAFNNWLLEVGLGKQEVVFDEQQLFDYFVNTGEEPAGAKISHTVVPEHATGTILKVDTQKVFDVMKEQLPQNVVALLGQGE